MTATATPVPAELDFIGCRARVLVSGREFGLVEMLEVPAGHMPPLHVHHNEDEGFYVLEGEVTLFLPGRSVVLRTGEFFEAPRGVPHTYRVGAGTARWLVTSVPGGFERFVADVAELEDAGPEELAQLADGFGIEILGAPGTMP